MDTTSNILQTVYLIGSAEDPEKVTETLRLAGYEISSPGLFSLLSARVVCFPGKNASKLAVKVARLLGREVVDLKALETANAKKANKGKEAILDFVARAIINRKVVFERTDPRIEEFLEITGEVGVLWGSEPVEPTEDNPMGFARDSFRRFYIYKSERDGYLLGVQGGDEEYYKTSGEEEIEPDRFFEIVRETQIEQYLNFHTQFINVKN